MVASYFIRGMIRNVNMNFVKAVARLSSGMGIWRKWKMSEIKLKPCSCCGTEPYTHFTVLKNDELHGFVSCNNPKCALKMSFAIKPSSILLNFNDVINGLHDIADRWNRREGGQNETD